MGIGTINDYVKFYVSLNMEKDVTLQSFVSNEKRILKGKLENKNMDKIKIQNGIEILNTLDDEIKRMGEKEVLEKYGR